MSRPGNGIPNWGRKKLQRNGGGGLRGRNGTRDVAARSQAEAFVWICVPTIGQVPIEFVASLVQMVSQLVVIPEGCPTFDYAFFAPRHSVLSQSREIAAQQALIHGATHLLFIDSDQTFPKDTVQRLLMRDEDVVAANIVTKKLVGSVPTARGFEEGNRAGMLVYTLPNSTGLEKVWRVGTGIMMIKTSVFQRLQQPWFPIVWVNDKEQYRGEDWTFCEQLQEKGINIFIDHDLSKEVGHVGPVEFRHTMVEYDPSKSASTSPTERERTAEVPARDIASAI